MFQELFTVANLQQISSWFKLFGVNSCQELMKVLQSIHNKHRPFDDVFLLSAEHLKRFDSFDHLKQVRIKKHLKEYWCCTKIENLNNHLKQNPPRVNFDNPDTISKRFSRKFCTTKTDLDNSIVIQSLMDKCSLEIDLPGSKYNPIGQGYYSDLFIHMFFGNYSDFIQHIEKLSEQELKRALNAREGYPQFSPVFAPVIGRRMIYIEQLPWLTKQNVRDIRTVWNGKNENDHFKILEKLLELGADVNAHDITGNTALDYACMYPDCDQVVPILFKYGADPNRREFFSTLNLYVERLMDKPEYWSVLDLLLDSEAEPYSYEEGVAIRILLENNYSSSKDLIAKAREVLIKGFNQCERTYCLEPAVKKCSACRNVVYCTPACQKLDWKFHKLTCMKWRADNVSIYDLF